MDALLELKLPDMEVEEDGVFEALVAVNHRWLGRYARLHPNFSVEPVLLERNSLWMNAFFQKSRMTTSAASPLAKNLIKKHRETVVERLRSAPLPHSESPFSTCVVDPMAALMFAVSIDRCPHNNLEDLLTEAWELLQCASIRAHALRSGLAGCIFRFLADFTETQKRIPCLRLLVLLAEENSSSVVNACKVAAQGQFWQPNMFIFSLQKRHQDNSTLSELAARLLECFSTEMPIPRPIVLDQSYDQETSPCRVPMTHLSPLRGSENGTALPLLTGGSRSPHRPLFSPTTTISKLYQEAPSPYCPTEKLPLTRPPTSPVEQSRRAKIFSMPKLAATDGQRQYRCNTPNAPPSRMERSLDVEACRALDPLFGSPPQSPSGCSPNRPRIVLSEKYSWNPECINSVSGFEWWWRSLPQNHASLEPTQKLKMVTKAAVRLHSKGELHRAIDLYLLALSSQTNDEVEFRLRINLACAYEAAEDLSSSIAEFRLALELNPSDPYAIYKLASVLTSTGEFEEARTRFESILGEYPQAAAGLKTLEKAVDVHKHEQETRQAAITAAKARRSPSKVISPRVFLTTLREPIAPSTRVAQPPAPRKKKIPTAKRDPPPSSSEDSEKNEPAVNDIPTKFESPLKPEPATTAMFTDDYLAAPSLLKLLVRRCQEARINMLEVLEQLDTQQRGLIHTESFLNLIRIIAGVDDLKSDDRVALGISSDDFVPLENQEFLQYGGFMNVYTQQYQIEVAFLNSSDVERVKRLVDDLIRSDRTNLSCHNVSEWLRLGSERAVAELYRRSSSSANSERNSCDNAAAAMTRRQSVLGSGTAGIRSAPDLRASEEDLFTPRTRARKDRARVEWILTAEKARVLARRQQHCMKSLRDIAARARTHLISRRNATAFLLVVAQNAQNELRARKLRCVTTRQETTIEFSSKEVVEAVVLTDSAKVVLGFNDPSDEAHLNTVKGLAEEIYDGSVRTAMVRLRQHTELEDLTTLAARFAAFCQIPPLLWETQAVVSDEGTRDGKVDDTME